jgi:hypothetical protein
MVRDWIRRRCPSRYEKSYSISAVFHTRSHLDKTWSLVEKGSYKLLRLPEPVKGIYDSLMAYNAYQKEQQDRKSGTVQPPAPATSLSEGTTESKSQGQIRHSSSDSYASQRSSMQPPALPPTPVSPLSSFSSLSSLPSVSSISSLSPSPADFATKPDNARPPENGGHREAVGAVLGQIHCATPAAKGVSTRAIVKPYAFTKEVLEESRVAWLIEKKSRKTAVASPEDYRQPVEKTMAFIMSLGS